MNGPLQVAICGGGNVAHVLAAAIGAVPGCTVRLLTRRPQEWARTVRAVYRDVFVEGAVNTTSDPAAAVDRVELVIVAAPAFAHAEIVSMIAPHLACGCWVGALPAVGGFDHLVRSLVPRPRRLFGSLRSPYNARIRIYGHVVEVSGIAPRLDLVVSPEEERDALDPLLGRILGLPLRAVTPFIAATLSPGSTIFHASRLFELCVQPPGRLPVPFYEDWGCIASETYLECDAELTLLCEALSISHTGETAGDHYGVNGADQLTERIRALAGLPRIDAPLLGPTSGATALKLVGTHRFIREDLPYGLAVVDRLADLAGLRVEAIRRVLETVSRLQTNSTLCDRNGLVKVPPHLEALSLQDWLSCANP